MDPRAQREAVATPGFDEGHVSILTSKEARKHVLRALPN